MPTLRALQAIRASVDDGEPIHVILDNLNHHKGRDVREWCAANRVELVFTPTYASWANPIEAHFGPLRQFVIANSDHRDHPALARAIRSYLRWRNAHTRDPDVLDAERRHRARIRSENNDDGATHEPPPPNAQTFVVRALAGGGQALPPAPSRLGPSIGGHNG